jgi:hypothetical protein
VIQEGVRRPRAIGDLDEHARCRGAPAQPTQLVDELADALVAGAAEPQPFRLHAEAAIDLGDRESRIVEPA